jgi:hypothetical protein
VSANQNTVTAKWDGRFYEVICRLNGDTTVIRSTDGMMWYEVSHWNTGCGQWVRCTPRLAEGDDFDALTIHMIGGPQADVTVE